MASSALEKIRLAQKRNRRGLEEMKSPRRPDATASSVLDYHRKQLKRERAAKVAPYRSSGHFLRDVHALYTGKSMSEALKTYDKAYVDYREKTLKQYEGKAFPAAMNESIMSDGGVMVPPQFANEILLRVYEDEMLSRVRLFNQLTSNTLSIPAIDETSRADGSRFGGVTSYWRQEGPPSALTASKPKEKNVNLKLETLYVFTKVTTEMLEDFPVLETFLSDIVAQEFRFRIGDSVVNGDGVGKPQGFLNSPSLKSIAAETGQAASTILTDNVFKMWSGMWHGCRKNGVWFVCNNAWPQLFKMTVGTIPIFLPQHTVDGAPYPTLLGRPVIETEFQPDLGTAGDIAFVDPTTLLYATKGDIRSFSSMHVYFDQGLHAFRFEIRIDGKSWWNSKLTLKYGSSNTVSNIVTVAAR